MKHLISITTLFMLQSLTCFAPPKHETNPPPYGTKSAPPPYNIAIQPLMHRRSAPPTYGAVQPIKFSHNPYKQ